MNTPANKLATPYVLGVVVLMGIAVARIAATYTTFNETYDEPLHLADGMEWLQQGNYSNQYQHPPLAGIATALAPFLQGLRSPRRWNPAQQGEAVIFEEGNEILYSRDAYWKNLTLARIGTLPFFALACAITFLWARRWFSPAAGLCAVLLLTTASPILGHAALATNDVACAAGTSLALYRFLRWLEQPDLRRGLWWGCATGIAVVCKFSSIPFLVACYAAGLLLWIVSKRKGLDAPAIRLRLFQCGAAAFAALMLMWAVYRFSVSPLAAAYGPHPRMDGLLSSRPILMSAWNQILATPLPLTEAILGVRDLYRHNSFGHDSYLLGQWSQSGWWYFFPVVLAVKTPIGFLLLALCGFGIILGRRFKAAWQQTATVLFSLAILAVCMAARIDLGVRHILPIYPMLAILAGHAAAELFRHSRIAAAIAVLLLSWAAADSWRAHPDYMAHFNEFAGSHPEAILCESDLDWGQDLDRLRQRLQQRGIHEFAIAYFGSALLHKSGLPHYELVSPKRPAQGYVAVSLHYLNIEYKKDGSFAWLKRYTPVERIGKSIDLFFIPE